MTRLFWVPLLSNSELLHLLHILNVPSICSIHSASIKRRFYQNESVVIDDSIGNEICNRLESQAEGWIWPFVESAVPSPGRDSSSHPFGIYPLPSRWRVDSRKLFNFAGWIWKEKIHVSISGPTVIFPYDFERRMIALEANRICFIFDVICNLPGVEFHLKVSKE